MLPQGGSPELRLVSGSPTPVQLADSEDMAATGWSEVCGESGLLGATEERAPLGGPNTPSSPQLFPVQKFECSHSSNTSARTGVGQGGVCSTARRKEMCMLSGELGQGTNAELVGRSVVLTGLLSNLVPKPGERLTWPDLGIKRNEEG